MKKNNKICRRWRGNVDQDNKPDRRGLFAVVVDTGGKPPQLEQQQEDQGNMSQVSREFWNNT